MSAILSQAIKRAGNNLNPDTLKEAMETLQNFETGGIFPALNYTETSHRPEEKIKLFNVDLTKKSFQAITDWRSPKKM